MKGINLPVIGFVSGTIIGGLISMVIALLLLAVLYYGFEFRDNPTLITIFCVILVVGGLLGGFGIGDFRVKK